MIYFYVACLSVCPYVVRVWVFFIYDGHVAAFLSGSSRVLVVLFNASLLIIFLLVPLGVFCASNMLLESKDRLIRNRCSYS